MNNILTSVRLQQGMEAHQLKLESKNHESSKYWSVNRSRRRDLTTFFNRGLNSSPEKHKRLIKAHTKTFKKMCSNNRTRSKTRHEELLAAKLRVQKLELEDEYAHIQEMAEEEHYCLGAFTEIKKNLKD